MGSDRNERKRRILYLIDRFRKGEASPQERREIDEWYADFDQEGINNYTDGMAEAEKKQAKDKLLHRINLQIYEESAPQRPRKRNWAYLVVPALVLISALAFGIYKYQQQQAVSADVHVAVADAEPGGNRAVLILGDGKRVSLTDAPDGQLARQQNIRVMKTTDGQLVYEKIAGKSERYNNEVVVYNSVETPNGGQYRLILPDGSKVWLNAASSLRYPASFGTLAERRVELSGEAYFEIAEDRNKPFLVSSGKQTVSVLGTRFNVNAYRGDPLMKTTLLEGSIKLSMDGNASGITLKPGQEALQQGPGFIVREADLQAAVAWKNGLFVFNSTDLQTLMRQLGRWYDVEVVYEGAIDYKRFFGSIERSYALSDVLEVLKLGNVNFRLEQADGGRTRLVVLPANNQIN